VKELSSFAAIDLGSNSFHMVIARVEHGELKVIDRLKEMVRLAAGLQADGTLSAAARNQAILCLAQFGQRLRELPSTHVRAVATNTVRRLKSPQAFLMAAETALGHPIEVISGFEEARLIYQGVARGLPAADKRRLVIDIGGGSTEFILGRGLEPVELESMQLGCSLMTLRHFPDGRLSEKRWVDARMAIEAELQLLYSRYRRPAWEEVIGSSGTIKATAAILELNGIAAEGISKAGIDWLRAELIRAGHIDRVVLPGLAPERRPVYAGGLVVLDAAFDLLGIEHMRVSDSALREGVLFDLVGRMEASDPRETAVAALVARHGVDRSQAARVEATALALFDQVAADWQLDDDDRAWLILAARAHEIGLSISHHHHQQHGAYLAEHSDLAGFSRHEQMLFAALLRNQRRGVSKKFYAELPPRLAQPALRLTVILRLSVLLHRARAIEPLPEISVRATPKQIHLKLAKRWLDAHPLTRMELINERKLISDLGVSLLLDQ
jgi:exopolyphosphatase / guanosine-5'-triphosphate,3'-diphosphate pyrophosphatase